MLDVSLELELESSSSGLLCSFNDFFGRKSPFGLSQTTGPLVIFLLRRLLLKMSIGVSTCLFIGTLQGTIIVCFFLRNQTQTIYRGIGF
mmetsp:Transcript_18480/g.38124  ORF Transcript_18480/g.38124 Transcript_18480/m.38124 type:complete len:89 (-) Transcript_18480:563-829(-)